MDAITLWGSAIFSGLAILIITAAVFYYKGLYYNNNKDVIVKWSLVLFGILSGLAVYIFLYS